jgi:uncharacterized membrane protein (DUF373 family)
MRFTKEKILKINKKFETFIVSILLFILMIIVVIITAEFVYLIILGIEEVLPEINSVELLQESTKRVFGAFLLVLLGIELMQTVKMYLTESKIHVEIVFVVAMIAVGRHIIQMDFHSEDPLTYLGVAAITIALAAGYFLIKKSRFNKDNTDYKNS